MIINRDSVQAKLIIFQKQDRLAEKMTMEKILNCSMILNYSKWQCQKIKIMLKTRFKEIKSM